MADSIPSLRRQLGEAMRRIAELEARGPVIERVEVIRDVEVPGPSVEVVRDVVKPVEVVREVYVDNPDHIATIQKLQEALRECRSTSQ